MKKGSLIILSGFSGAGKGTIVRRLLETHDNYALSISATTRAPREGETHGKEYFFLTREEFERRIACGALLEYAEYVGNYYGTPRDYVESQLEQGKDVILEIEMQGALKVKQVFPEAVLIFVTTKDAATLRDRLVGRGTETEEVIRKRLHRSAQETELMRQYDYLLVNDELEECVSTLHQIIMTQHHRVCSNQDFIERISTQLKELDPEKED